MSTTELLQERNTTHGDFADNARYGQALRDFMRGTKHWTMMPDQHKEALDMIACKLSRILSGQSDFKDHWDDIAGYALLAAKDCQ